MDHLADRTGGRLGLRVGLIATLLAAISAFRSAARPPDPCTPTSFVRVSDGTTITPNDISEFDAVWMSDACRQKAHGDASSVLNYHDLLSAGGLGEGTAVLAHIYEMTRQQRYVAELYELITLALSLSGVQVIHQVSHSEGRSP